MASTSGKGAPAAREEASWLDLGRRVPPGTYPAADFPLFPAQMLFNHLIAKAVQFGAVTGFAVAPVWKVLRKKPLAAVVPRALTAGTAVGFLGTVALMVQLERKGDLGTARVDDRAYRIHKSASQNRVDAYAAVAGCAGASLGSILGRHALRSVYVWGMGGIALGTLVAAGQNAAEAHPDLAYVREGVDRIKTALALS
jgi:hypothetical protein